MDTPSADRTDIQFPTDDGVILRGWHYQPDTAGPHPTVVMAHGLSAVKEMYLDRYAERLAAHGLASIVYDHRNLGASDGEPRGEIDPIAQIRGYRDAITYAQTLDQTDNNRIGVWGSSYSGGHVLVVAADDRRVKAVVSQLPAISGSKNLRRIVRSDYFADFHQMWEADRQSRYNGGEPAVIPVVSDDPLAPCLLPMTDALDFFTTVAAERAPSWINQVTLRSAEMLNEYEPGAVIDKISPTPLLMMVATEDHITVPDLAFEAYQRALEPKQLLTVPGGHFDAYTTHFDITATAAAEFFADHL